MTDNARETTMLDKSIPYKNIVMLLPAADAVSVRPSPLPEGFSARLFQDGDERHWARIETSVLEFETEEKALDFFARDFLPWPDELRRRCVFIIDPAGLPAATATAWYFADKDTRQAHIHWVSVQPGLQGKGLGRAVMTRALSLFPELEPGRDVILHTQTWSHPAVMLYDSLGFRMVREDGPAMLYSSPEGTRQTPNDYAEALTVLDTVLKPEQVARLKANTL